MLGSFHNMRVTLSSACLVLIALSSSPSVLAPSIAQAATEFGLSGLQCRQVPYLFEAFLRNHYSHKTINDEIKNHTVAQFIKELDPSKTMLLAADVDKLKRDLPSVFQSMKLGDCH